VVIEAEEIIEKRLLIKGEDITISGGDIIGEQVLLTLVLLFSPNLFSSLLES
jgi:hypothetical protein